MIIKISAAGGHRPPGTHGQLVRDILNTIRATPTNKITLVVPAGDSEALDVIRQQCRHVATHAAGATCIIEAER